MRQLILGMLMAFLILGLAGCGDDRGNMSTNKDSQSSEEEKIGEEQDAEEKEGEKSQLTEETEEDMNTGEAHWISGSIVNFRKTPSTEGEVICQLTKGTEIFKLYEDGDWLYIRYGERTGYIHKDYVSKYPPKNPENGDVSIIVKNQTVRWNYGKAKH